MTGLRYRYDTASKFDKEVGLGQVSIEKIIEAVTVEVIKQLKQNGMSVTIDSGKASSSVAQALMGNCGGVKNKTERIDMSKYKSPVLTEKQIDKLHELTGKNYCTLRYDNYPQSS